MAGTTTRSILSTPRRTAGTHSPEYALPRTAHGRLVPGFDTRESVEHTIHPPLTMRRSIGNPSRRAHPEPREQGAACNPDEGDRLAQAAKRVRSRVPGLNRRTNDYCFASTQALKLPQTATASASHRVQERIGPAEPLVALLCYLKIRFLSPSQYHLRSR